MTDAYSGPCGHAYSHAVLELLGKNHGAIACPVTGCQARLTRQNVHKNRSLSKRIQMELKRQKDQRLEDSFGDEDQ
jgi:hypothetical protein